ncbi:hypothetical protein ACO1O0_008419 [Amphichorda felina]
MYGIPSISVPMESPGRYLNTHSSALREGQARVNGTSVPSPSTMNATDDRGPSNAVSSTIIAQAFHNIKKLEDPSDFVDYYMWVATIMLISVSMQLDGYFSRDTVRHAPGSTPKQNAELAQASLLVYDSLGPVMKRQVTMWLWTERRLPPAMCTPCQLMEAIEVLINNQDRRRPSSSSSDRLSQAQTVVNGGYQMDLGHMPLDYGY